MATQNSINVGVVAGGGNTYTFPAATDTLVGRTSTDTLTNKTIQGAAITGALTGTGAYIPVTLLNSGTSASGTTFWRGDGTWATPAGGGTVTATGGALTANSIVLGAGTTDTKVVAGIITDGTSVITLGVNTTTIGKLKLFGNTSGDATIQPAAVAGTATVQTLPATTGTLVNRVTTANGVSASNTDGALTVSLGAITPTTVNGNTFTTGTYTLTGTAGKTLNFTNSLTLSGTDGNTFTFPSGSDTVVTLGASQTLTSKTLTSPVLTTPVINGTATGTGVSATPTALIIPLYDASANLSADNFLAGYTTTATAAGTTTLTVSSTYQQFFTGVTTQTVTLPVTSTLILGHQFYIQNNSSGAVTVQSSGANTIIVMASNTTLIMTCILTSGTTGASWDNVYRAVSIASGKKGTINNSITFTGTDATTMTFPTTSATIARTDTAQTFTGVQTLSSSPVLSTNAITGSGANTVTLFTSSDTVVGRATTDTLTNKTIYATTNLIEEKTTTGSSATPTPTGGSNRNYFTITAQAAAGAFAAPSGTPVEGNRLLVRIKDNATARALTWNAIYRASSDLALPSTTILSKTLYCGFVYNGTDGKWDLLAVLNNF